MPNKTVVATTAAPAAIGPYSQAVLSGDLLFTSGQVAIDPATGDLITGDITAQTRQVIKNLEAVLTQGGASLRAVIKTTVFLQNMTDFAAMNAVYAEHFAPEGVVAPARSTVQVSALPKGGLVEIECIARVA